MVIFGINTTSDISKLLYVMWDNFEYDKLSDIYAKYHVQIMLLFFLYYYPQKVCNFIHV